MKLAYSNCTSTCGSDFHFLNNCVLVLNPVLFHSTADLLDVTSTEKGTYMQRRSRLLRTETISPTLAVL
jgi:hypothetical protein